MPGTWSANGWVSRPIMRHLPSPRHLPGKPLSPNPRAAAARVLGQVLAQGQSLSTALPPLLARVAGGERGLFQELCYGTLRWYPRLEVLLHRLLHRPLHAREAEVQALLLIGLYQLLYLRIPDHAVVAETVAATRDLGKTWATGLVNAVLRNLQRQRDTWLAELAQDPVGRYAHPQWLLQRLQHDWPADWLAIVAANNAHPPCTLRVNLSRLSRATYLERLATVGLAASASPVGAAAVTLATACGPEALPGFAEGEVSFQDAAAQLAAGLLDLRPGLRVLDACAAPGGKTGHILETEPALAELVALDQDEARLRRVADNLRRLGLHARLQVGDATTPETWWNGVPFDRILVDAPCSGTGVIRRHPDIKRLRRADDGATLAVTQRRLLNRLWPLLAAGGRLVYATCSLLAEENEDTMAVLLSEQADAQELPILADWGRPRHYGRQLLPGEQDMDGFYYACLVKTGG